MTEYLAEYAAWNYTEYDWYYPPLYGESTPFYIASRSACERISRDVPNVKMIILLREPVSRAYSEVNIYVAPPSDRLFIELSFLVSHEKATSRTAK